MAVDWSWPLIGCVVRQIPSEDKEKTAVKVIVTGEDEKVVGIHVIGMGADEMMQGFGVAMKVKLLYSSFLPIAYCLSGRSTVKIRTPLILAQMRRNVVAIAQMILEFRG